MSKPPSIAAAVERLSQYPAIVPDRKDVWLVCDALRHLETIAVHLDARDGNPVYEIRLNADWRAKDLLTALGEAIARSAVEEDSS